MLEHDISNQDIANYTKSSEQQVSKWVNGKTLPRLENALIIAKVLKCSIHDIWEVKE